MIDDEGSVWSGVGSVNHDNVDFVPRVEDLFADQMEVDDSIENEAGEVQDAGQIVRAGAGVDVRYG